jgi:hypothetical protein
MARININLNLNLITPARLKIHFVPRSFDIDLQNMFVFLGDADGVDWNDVPEDHDNHVVSKGDGGEGGDVEAWVVDVSILLGMYRKGKKRKKRKEMDIPRTPKALMLVSTTIFPFSNFSILFSTTAAAPAIFPSNPKFAIQVVSSFFSSTNPLNGYADKISYPRTPSET